MAHPATTFCPYDFLGCPIRFSGTSALNDHLKETHRTHELLVANTLRQYVEDIRELREMKKMEARISQLEARLTGHGDHVTQAEASVQGCCQQFQETVQTYDNRLSQLEARLTGHGDHVTQAEASVQGWCQQFQETVQTYDNKLDELISRQIMDDDRITEIKSSLVDVENEVKSVRETITSTDKKIEDLKQTLDPGVSGTQQVSKLERLEEMGQNILAQQAIITAEHDEFKNLVQEAKTDFANLDGHCNVLSRDWKTLADKQNKLETQVEKQNKDHGRRQDELVCSSSASSATASHQHPLPPVMVFDVGHVFFVGRAFDVRCAPNFGCPPNFGCAPNAGCAYGAGVITWNLTHFSHWTTLMVRSRTTIHSPFYNIVRSSRYNMRLMMESHGVVGEADTRIYLGIMVEPIDNYFSQWPFKQEVIMEIVDRSEASVAKNKQLTIPAGAFISDQKTPNRVAHTPGWSFSASLSLGEINTDRFVKEDTLLIICKIPE